MDFFKDLFGNDSAAKKGLCIALALVILVSSGYFAGTLTSINVKADIGSSAAGNANVNSGATTQSAPVVNTTNAPVTNAPVTNAPSADTSTAPEETPAPDAGTDSSEMTKEEIITLFNEAANKVKTEATVVTRNYKYCRYDQEKSILPSALESMANPMIEKYVKDELEPEVYDTQELIIEKFPAPKQTYSSALTPADVEQATCVDNGTEYEVTLNLVSETNPQAGTGIGAACHIMDMSAISSNSMVKKFDTIYEGCVIKCKIDKATSRVTWANYHTPLVMDASVSVVFSDVAVLAYMLYERDYSVTY